MTATIDIPQRIGRFRIHSMLGRGAMGVVYKGHDEQIDRPVAIKLIRTDLLDGEERENYFRRFRNEAKISGRCVHANIVGLYDFSFHESNPYLVMEYVDGVGLQQVLPRGTQWREEEVLPIALQALDALQYAHERGIVHRDVKPPNILLTTESKLKITDFGISRLTSTEQTVTPLLIGTPSYMSPEQCMGASLDGRSDLFSLGCVLYELLAGRRPFTGANYTDTILSIINRPHPPLQDFREDLTFALIDVIDRALAKNPGDRFPDADAFALALEQISGSPFRVPAIPRNLADIVVASQPRDTQGGSARVPPRTPAVSGDDADTVLAPRATGPESESVATGADTGPAPDASAPDASAPDHSLTSERGAARFSEAPDAGLNPAMIAPLPPPGGGEPHAPEALLDAAAVPSGEETRISADTPIVHQDDDDATRIMPVVLPGMERAADAAVRAVMLAEADETAVAAESAGTAEGLPAHEPLPVLPGPVAEAAEQSGAAALGAGAAPVLSNPGGIAGSEAAGASDPEDTALLREEDLAFPGDDSFAAAAGAHDAEDDWESWQSWTAVCLTRVIGPIGPIVVAHFRDDARPQSLIGDCARFIRHDAERADFLRFVNARLVPETLIGGGGRS